MIFQAEPLHLLVILARVISMNISSVPYILWLKFLNNRKLRYKQIHFSASQKNKDSSSISFEFENEFQAQLRQLSVLQLL